MSYVTVYVPLAWRLAASAALPTPFSVNHSAAGSCHVNSSASHAVPPPTNTPIGLMDGQPVGSSSASVHNAAVDPMMLAPEVLALSALSRMHQVGQGT